ncbi:sushi, von Willebrand factor type A, EGF and pentraxin domain-containing protein 1-like isoform X2 [Halichondria panicea]|uniref:sushi, von Willebrand factor type A, EGF and pentraxin domain-containing protein 1-like isoform X2 n=1 Tax=Halichondria panicea TaxID=6063 RepID=UPI00312B9A9A
MATVTLFLCCLLGSVSLVYGQTLIRLALPSDPSGTDRTGQIISFSDFGPGANSVPPALYCYNNNNGAVTWVFPGGNVPVVFNRPATGDELFISAVGNPRAVILHRGPTHFSPDGEHCCRRNDNSLRICVTFTPCPTLSPLTNSNGRISYDPDTNIATYGCVPGYAPTITSGDQQRTCQSDGTSAGTWTGTAATLTCALSSIDCGGTPPSITNGSPGAPTSTTLGGFVTYTCNTGYEVSTGVTTAMATCMASGTWGPLPTCQIVDCGSPTTIDNGSPGSPTSTTYQGTVTYTCVSGYEVSTGVTTAMASCMASGTWGPLPTCSRVSCGDPPPGNNASPGSPTSTVYQGTVTYTCTPGYWISRGSFSATATCGANGMWGPLPTCTVVDCGSPPTIDNGSPGSPTSTTYQGTVAYTCVSGYEASTGVTTAMATCLASGAWGPLPTCSRVSCGDPPSGNNASPGEPTSTVYQGAVTYTCVTGYWISPTVFSRFATCGANRMWNPVLTCTAVDCGPLTINNGQVSTSPGTTFGGIATYTCNTGYTQNGPSTRTCQADTVWRGDAPTCDALCPREPLSNGMVTYSPSDDPPQPGAVATYSCDTGYELSGASMRNCVAVSGWSTSLPVCNPVDCGPLTIANGAVDTSSGTTFMMTATYTCNTGYTLIGANTRTCGGDGQWTPDAPTCLQLLAVISPSGGPMAGQSFSLTCSLSGGASLQPTLSYQWTREGGPLMTNTATLNFDTLYLSDAGQYSCQVILTSSQLEGEHTVAAHYTIEFRSLHIQLGLEGITNCRVYTEQDADMKTDDITNSLTQGIESQCACGFNSSLILNPFIVCFDDSPSHVTYRAVLTGSESVSTIQLARLMEQWVENDPIVVVQSAGLSVTNSCPIVIANLNSPECPEDITNRTTATTSPTESVVVNVGAVAGGVVAGVLAIAVLVLIVIVVLLLLRLRRSGSKDMSDEKTGNQPTQLPPVVMSHLPSHDYEGLSKLQEEATYEVVDQPRPPPPADYQLSACATYASTDFNTENK